MKLVFPGNEHPQVLLAHGVSHLGRDPGGDVVIDRPSVLPQHADLLYGPLGVSLRVHEGADVTVNGRPVQGLIALRAGDEVGLAGLLARLVAISETQAGQTGAAAEPGAELAATTVRPVVPRHSLRGLAGDVFGRSHALHTATVVGRAEDADLRLEAPGISRQHARLTPTDAGVMVDDLGSANGTFLNGKRISHALASNGDEVAFDTVRFQVLAPVSEVAVTQADARSQASVPRWVMILAALTAIASAVWFHLR